MPSLMWRLRAYQQCLYITGTMRSELTIDNDRAGWTPANLIENEWWYWRVRLVDQEWTGLQRQARPSRPVDADPSFLLVL